MTKEKQKLGRGHGLRSVCLDAGLAILHGNEILLWLCLALVMEAKAVIGF
jgi:hypothetical protein